MEDYWDGEEEEEEEEELQLTEEWVARFALTDYKRALRASCAARSSATRDLLSPPHPLAGKLAQRDEEVRGDTVPGQLARRPLPPPRGGDCVPGAGGYDGLQEGRTVPQLVSEARGGASRPNEGARGGRRLCARPPAAAHRSRPARRSAVRRDGRVARRCARGARAGGV